MLSFVGQSRRLSVVGRCSFRDVVRHDWNISARGQGRHYLKNSRFSFHIIIHKTEVVFSFTRPYGIPIHCIWATIIEYGSRVGIGN